MAILPKIVYNFNENNTSLIRDYSENGNDGTGSNLTIQDSARVGKEAIFNGVSDIVDLGNITYLNGSAAMSLHLGVKINSTTSSGYIVHKDSQIIAYYNDATSEIEISLFVGSGTAAVSAAVVDNTYHDIDVVYEDVPFSETDTLSIYVDGVLIDSDSTQGGVIDTAGNDLTIGRGLTSAYFYLNEFKLYNEAITTDIIASVIRNANGVLSDTGTAQSFSLGDVIYADLETTPKYGVVTYIDSTTTTEFRFLPLTVGIISSSIFRRGGHLWDASRQWGLIIDDTPKICFYDGQSKSSEVFAESKITYSLGVDGVDSSKLIIIDKKESLPAPVSNVITLESGYTYLFAGFIDLEGDRLDTNGIVSLLGSSPEVAGISSTGLAAGTAILTSEYTISIRHLEINHTTGLDLDATANANQALDWFGVNFKDNTTAIGTVKNYGNTIFNTIGFLNSGGLTFDGTIGTIAFTDTIFENASGLTSIILPATLTVSRRFRINECSMISLSGETALNVSTSASIPDEGYILLNVNFGGGGTYLTGVQSTDNKARFSGCRGINNSSNIAQYYMQGNATATTISTASTFVKIAGATTTGSYVEKFDVTTTDNKAVYTGSLTGFYKVHVISACTAGNNQELEIAIYKNGSILTPSRSKGTTTGSGKAESLSCQDIVEMATNDYIEIFITNNTATTNVTVEDLNITVIRLN